MQSMNTQQKKYIAGALLFAALTLLAASWYLAVQQADYREALRTELTHQEETMLSSANLIDRDEADGAINQIVTDCPTNERQRFDQLLSSLSQLDRNELSEIQGLFDACANFYATRQAILSMRLDREYELYERYVDLLGQTDAEVDRWAERASRWGQLSDIENERSDLTLQLVNIQGEIIDMLASGRSATSEEITERLDAAQSTKDSLSVLNQRADNARETLGDL